MSKKFLMACVQLNSSNQLQENLERCRYWIREAAERDVELVCLPEDFAFLARAEAEKQGLTEQELQHITDVISAEAVRHKIFILAGGHPVREKETKKFFNTSSLIGPNGKILCQYQKIHLFDAHPPGAKPILESEQMLAGNQLQVAETRLCKIGFSICYDLRFPELYRQLALKGAELLTVPAAFTLTTGNDHWEILLRSRAIENQCYLIAPAQWGKHSENRHSFGKAMIIDPWGSVLASVGENEGIAVAEFCPDKIDHVRSIVPVHKHLRKDIFSF